MLTRRAALRRYEEPTRVGENLYFTAAGSDLATPGATYWVLRVPLKDGRTLYVHMPDETRHALHLTPSDAPSMAPTQTAMPLDAQKTEPAIA